MQLRAASHAHSCQQWVVVQRSALLRGQICSQKLRPQGCLDSLALQQTMQ